MRRILLLLCLLASVLTAGASYDVVYWNTNFDSQFTPQYGQKILVSPIYFSNSIAPLQPRMYSCGAVGSTYPAGFIISNMLSGRYTFDIQSTPRSTPLIFVVPDGSGTYTLSIADKVATPAGTGFPSYADITNYVNAHAGSSGSATNLTPWTSDINGGGFSLTNANNVKADIVVARSLAANGNATFANHGNAGSPLTVDEFTGTNALAQLYNTVNGRSVLMSSNADITIGAGVFSGDGSGLTNISVVFPQHFGAVMDSNPYTGGGTDDSRGMQAALDQATNGPIEVVVRGTALISTNLIIRSNTRLRFMPGAGLFVADHANCWPLGNLQNTNYATTNIEIIGGILNCNGNAQTEFYRGGTNHIDPGVWGLWLSGVDGAVLRDVTLISPKTYSYLFTDSRNIYVEHCQVIFTNNPAFTNVIYGNDGLHFMCNLTNIHVNGFRDTAGNDDTFAFNTDETDNTLPVRDSRWTTNSGSIDNVTLENIFLDGVKNIGKFQSYGSTNARAANVTLRNIHGRLGSQGSQGLAVLSQRVFFNTGDYTVRMPNFTIDGLSIDLPNAWSVNWVAIGAVDLSSAASDRIILNNIRITDLAGVGMGVPSPGGAYIGLGSDNTNVQMSNISISGPLDGSGTLAGDPAIFVGIIGTNASPNAPRISIANLQVKDVATAIDGQAPGIIRVVNSQISSGVVERSSLFTNYLNAGLTTAALARGGTGASLSDPNANTLLGWDDTDNAVSFLTLGTGLTYTHATHTLSAPTGGSGDALQAGNNVWTGSNFFSGPVVISNGTATTSVSNLNVTGWALQSARGGLTIGSSNLVESWGTNVVIPAIEVINTNASGLRFGGANIIEGFNAAGTSQFSVSRAGVLTASGSGLTASSVPDAALQSDVLINTRTITLAVGSASLTTSAGAQDLSANRTWTLDTAQNIQSGASPTFIGNNFTALQITNLVSTVFAMGSDSNQITLNKELWSRQLTGAGQLSNVTGTGWATLVLSNSTATATNFYFTNAIWRQIGASTTNFAPAGVLSIPAGKVAYATIDNRWGFTAYWVTLQQ